MGFVLRAWMPAENFNGVGKTFHLIPTSRPHFCYVPQSFWYCDCYTVLVRYYSCHMSNQSSPTLWNIIYWWKTSSTRKSRLPSPGQLLSVGITPCIVCFFTYSKRCACMPALQIRF